MPVCEEHRFAALEDDDVATRLRAGPLLDEQDLAASVVCPALAEDTRALEREGERTVDVLM